MGKPTQASSQLTAAFFARNIDLNEFILDFDFWKSLPGDQETDVFGRDGANRGSKYFRHVHIVPFNNAVARTAWEQNFQKGHRNRSNRYLFYVDGGPAYGYLLLTVIDDPACIGGEGAHDIWKPQNADLLAKLNALADGFFYNGTVP